MLPQRDAGEANGIFEKASILRKLDSHCRLYRKRYRSLFARYKRLRPVRPLGQVGGALPTPPPYNAHELRTQRPSQPTNLPVITRRSMVEVFRKMIKWKS